MAGFTFRPRVTPCHRGQSPSSPVPTQSLVVKTGTEQGRPEASSTLTLEGLSAIGSP